MPKPPASGAAETAYTPEKEALLEARLQDLGFWTSRAALGPPLA